MIHLENSRSAFNWEKHEEASFIKRGKTGLKMAADGTQKGIHRKEGLAFLVFSFYVSCVIS